MSIEQVNGVRVNYNTREYHEGLGKHSTFGARNQLVASFSYDNLPSAGDSGDAVIPELPAGAVVTSAYLIVTTAFAGGTSLEVGVVGDTDAFITPAAGALANIDANGDVLVGGGASVNASLAAAAKPVVTAVGDFTAGEAKLVIEYLTV